MAHGWQPIAAQQFDLTLAPGESETILFGLGYIENPEEEKWEAPGVVNKTRARAVTMAPAICTYDGATDWEQVKSLAAEAVASGDWSGMYPHFYSRSRKNDTRIGTIAGLAKKAVEADRKDVARDLLENCARTLGFFADGTLADAGDNSQEDYDLRLKALTNALNTCEGKLPKRP